MIESEIMKIGAGLLGGMAIAGGGYLANLKDEPFMWPKALFTCVVGATWGVVAIFTNEGVIDTAFVSGTMTYLTQKGLKAAFALSEEEEKSGKKK